MFGDAVFGRIAAGVCAMISLPCALLNEALALLRAGYFAPYRSPNLLAI